MYQTELVRVSDRGEVTHINKFIYFYLPMLCWLWLHCWLHLLAEWDWLHHQLQHLISASDQRWRVVQNADVDVDIFTRKSNQFHLLVSTISHNLTSQILQPQILQRQEASGEYAQDFWRQMEHIWKLTGSCSISKHLCIHGSLQNVTSSKSNMF